MQSALLWQLQVNAGETPTVARDTILVFVDKAEVDRLDRNARANGRPGY